MRLVNVLVLCLQITPLINTLCEFPKPPGILEAAKCAAVIALRQREATTAAADVARVTATATADAAFNAAMQRKQAMLREAHCKSQASLETLAVSKALKIEREHSHILQHGVIEALGYCSSDKTEMKGSGFEGPGLDDGDSQALTKAQHTLEVAQLATQQNQYVRGQQPDNKEEKHGVQAMAAIECRHSERGDIRSER